MNYLLEAIGDVRLSAVIIIIAAMVFVVRIGFKAYRYLEQSFKKKKEGEDSIKSIVRSIQKIERQQEDFKHSIDTIQTSLNALEERQENIAEKQEEMDEQKKARDLNKLRDLLLQNFRYYTNLDKNPRQEWSEMESQAFWGLFKDYEDLGGNGFMHSTVQPAMNQLDVVDMTDDKKIELLMQSRKG